ncbi:MAG TPA: tetratricopeptide repeat protein [Drouetiella sp.]
MPQISMSTELHTLRQTGVYGRVTGMGMMAVVGPDATRFLQSQTTNDVAKLPELGSQHSCILDRKAHVKAYFDLYRKHKSFRIIAESDQIERIMFHLDTYRFADKVEFINETAHGAFFAVQGPKALQCIAAGLQSSGFADALKHDLCVTKLFGHSCLIFKKSLCGEDGFLIRSSINDAEAIAKKMEEVCKKESMIAMTADLMEVARIEAGMPYFGIDFSDANFLPEAGIAEQTVSYTKGCFLGQEVLARIKSQGAPTRGLVGLQFEPLTNSKFEMDTKVSGDAGDVALIKSNCFSPTLDTTVALAFVKRDQRIPDKVLSVKINGAPHTVTVKMLPFVKSKNSSERARDLFEQALRVYTKEDDALAQSEAVTLLRQALELDPKFEDVYEALGVILHKRGEIDEAIDLMKTLVELNADSVMAHTNLSVFYVDKGMKEEAEEEKAISLSIRMREAAMKAAQDQKDTAERQRRIDEATQRLEMFKQVLEIDSEDLLANYGIGSCLVALENFDDAIPYLTKAIEIKPTHTVAYVSLAEAFEGLGRDQEAMDTYTTGVEVASKRGDMSPMNDMQRKLLALTARMKNAK